MSAVTPSRIERAAYRKQIRHSDEHPCGKDIKLFWRSHGSVTYELRRQCHLIVANRSSLVPPTGECCSPRLIERGSARIDHDLLRGGAKPMGPHGWREERPKRRPRLSRGPARRWMGATDGSAKQVVPSNRRRAQFRHCL